MIPPFPLLKKIIAAVLFKIMPKAKVVKLMILPIPIPEKVETIIPTN